jgi:hypothetical protein
MQWSCNEREGHGGIYPGSGLQMTGVDTLYEYWYSTLRTESLVVGPRRDQERGGSEGFLAE